MTTKQIEKNREYETIYIMNPAVDPDEADRIATRVTDVIGRHEGKVTKLDNWGKRKLAYPIAKSTRGVFVYFKYVGGGNLVAEIERNLRMIDAVVRFQTVKVRDDVSVEALQIDPEDVKFRRLEVTEDEADLTLEQKLGMVEAPRPERVPEAEDEFMDDTIGEDDDAEPAV